MAHTIAIGDVVQVTGEPIPYRVAEIRIAENGAVRMLVSALGTGMAIAPQELVSAEHVKLWGEPMPMFDSFGRWINPNQHGND